MIGLDTNVLVRYIVQDDPEQAEAAERLIESRCTTQSPGFVAIPVLVELVWVVAAAYRYERPVVASVIRPASPNGGTPGRGPRCRVVRSARARSRCGGLRGLSNRASQSRAGL